MNNEDGTMPDSSVMPVSRDQEKLLQSALRIKIIRALADEPLTSKQVAQRLGRTPGNVHYHIQKLYEGGFLELVRTEAAGGIMQKFYRAKATWFRSSHYSGFQFGQEDIAEQFTTRLSLSEKEFAEFRQEMMQLIAHWESKDTHGGEYGVEVVIGRLLPPETEPERNGGAT